MKNSSPYRTKLKALNKTIVILFIVYFATAFIFTYKSENIQKEIQANFYGVKIESDGKGAFPSKQKPYVCVEKDVNLIYTHECSKIAWVGTILARLLLNVLFIWLWFFVVPIRAVVFVIGGIAIFSVFYFLEKRKNKMGDIEKF